MAQAARLSLRMQKELKLLLTDPPPGACFPLLSDSDLCSLTSIDADIEGPDGTVYENGIFRVKIQIPERYPFQPPNVTFATPIYHPNIDNGGRICLDILNLPPKGAWQPSLNISTVITSIGLLLSEPNPDDGLMCEASKEYKYNRQAFDQKARFMTQKHAKAGASGSIISSSSSSQLNSLSSPPSCTKTEGSTETLVVSHFSKTNQKKSLGLIRRKLSLESSKGRSTDIEEANKVLPDTEPGGANNKLEKENGKNKNQMENMNRVEQGSSLQETAAVEKRTLQVGKPCVVESTPPSAESSYTCQMRKEQLMKPDVSDSSRGHEKIGSRSRKLSLGLKAGNSFQKFEGANKENQPPIRKLQLSRPRSTFGTSMIPSNDLKEVNDGESRFKGSSAEVLKSKPHENPVDEDESARGARENVVIVLDSEDSDEEDNRCSRRGGLLARKRIRRSDLKFPTAT